MRDTLFRIFVIRVNNFKTARKTYNTLATELEISETIRRILLGHSSVGVNEKHYTNRRTITLSEKVQKAHLEILEDFRFGDLAMKLYDKMSEILKEETGTTFGILT